VLLGSRQSSPGTGVITGVILGTPVKSGPCDIDGRGVVVTLPVGLGDVQILLGEPPQTKVGTGPVGLTPTEGEGSGADEEHFMDPSPI
jgi:hypothetical protein